LVSAGLAAAVAVIMAAKGVDTEIPIG